MSLEAKRNPALELAATWCSNASVWLVDTGNLHKWMYCPKGTAFLWASPEFQSRIVPPVLSGTQLFSDAGPNMASDFEYVGTRDYTNYAAVPAVSAVDLDVVPIFLPSCFLFRLSPVCSIHNVVGAGI